MPLKKRKPPISARNRAGLPGVHRLLFSAVLALLLPLCAASQPAAIQQLIAQSGAGDAIWSLQVRDSSGTVLLEWNADKLMRPASNLKLISSSAFLSHFGSDFRFQTHLYVNGSVNESGVLRGDLIVRGSGDPTMNYITYDDPLDIFSRWAAVLDSIGIREIDGNIIGHEGLFDDIPYPKGWEWDDLSYYYAPELSALSFNSNVVNLEVMAGDEPGTAPSIQWSPMNTPYVQFINEQVVTPIGTRFEEDYRRILGTNTIFLRSTLPVGYYETEPLSVHDPARYFADTLKRYLQQRGTPVRGQALTTRQFYDWQLFRKVHTEWSPPLGEMVVQINRESDNFYTEMLLKAMAASRSGVNGSTENGLQMLREFMISEGFSNNAITLRDASGMAPATLLRTSELNAFLVNVMRKPYFEEYYNSLATGGQNGTLKYRFGGTELINSFQGKTGFVSGVRSLSGYLDTRSGTRLVVTIITNNYTLRTSQIDRVHEQILQRLMETY
ncbi:MAG: D-alanyl-D-alanine carboxypeptidase/D-alanyl-D-alanine-endopeptidase [Balneolaceae bacterium]